MEEFLYLGTGVNDQWDHSVVLRRGIDFKKASDPVIRNRLWKNKGRIVEEKRYPIHLEQTIKNLYEDSKIIIKTSNSRTEETIINQEVRQGCSLSRHSLTSILIITS